jgi:ERF superfamily
MNSQLVSMPVQPATPMEMLNRALMSGAAPETLEKMLVLQERWEKNEARKAFDRAITAAKSKLPVIKKNRTVSYGAGKTAYAHEDLAEIERTVVPILSEHGLSYRFRTNVTDKSIIVTCIISHQEGHSEENSLPGPADTSGSKNALQAIGSAVTYLQRYTLKAALGLSASEDDDAVSVKTNGNGNGNGHLSDDQIEDLRSAIVDAGADIDRFCKVYGIQRVEDLPARRLGEAKAKLAAFKRQQEKAP